MISRWFVPQIPISELVKIFKIAIGGAVVGGGYGAIHDLVTYSISPECFTKIKFHQFSYIRLGLPDQIFAAEVGFVASGWVGFFSAWFMARILVPRLCFNESVKLCLYSFTAVMFTAVCGAFVGFYIGKMDVSHFEVWLDLTARLKVNEISAFICVICIHYGSYIGGLLGLFATLIVFFKKTWV